MTFSRPRACLALLRRSQRWLVFCMRKHLLLGFPLDLYSQEDYPMVYWRAPTQSCPTDRKRCAHATQSPLLGGTRTQTARVFVSAPYVLPCR